MAASQQAQVGNETLEIALNSTQVYVDHAIEVEGLLTPPQVAGILITLTWPDGSWTNFRVNSTETGAFSWTLYIPMAGQFRLVATVTNVTQVTSNTLSFFVSYKPINETSSTTTSNSSSRTTSSSGGPSSSSPSAKPILGGLSHSAVLTVTFFAGTSLLIVVSAYFVRREARQNANIEHEATVA